VEISVHLLFNNIVRVVYVFRSHGIISKESRHGAVLFGLFQAYQFSKENEEVGVGVGN
jgi:hypothetical protein